jgi:hypothetical protein
MTLYLLDANVLIRAHEDYYPIDRIPQFWAWLHEQSREGLIKMPREIYDEVARSGDMLGDWLRVAEHRTALVLAEPTDAAQVRHVIAHGYAPDLNDIELENLGRDPFLVAAALNGANRMVVTREVSRPNKQRANRKVPDVCATFGLSVLTDFALYRALHFRIV